MTPEQQAALDATKGDRRLLLLLEAVAAEREQIHAERMELRAEIAAIKEERRADRAQRNTHLAQLSSIIGTVPMSASASAGEATKACIGEVTAATQAGVEAGLALLVESQKDAALSASKQTTEAIAALPKPVVNVRAEAPPVDVERFGAIVGAHIDSGFRMLAESNAAAAERSDERKERSDALTRSAIQALTAAQTARPPRQHIVKRDSEGHVIDIRSSDAR